MTNAEQTATILPEDRVWLQPGWLQRSLGPLLIAAVIVTIVAILVVFSSRTAWHLLGIGRGLVAPEFYHYTGLFIVLGTTFGQFVGWAVGSALVVFVWSRLTAVPVTYRVVRVSMTLVYCGLAVVPIVAYHVLFGRPLAGMPQSGLPAWLSQNAPDAYGLLMIGHPIADWCVIPLALAVLVVLWGYGERAMRHRGLQTLLLFLVLATSFVVALSLAIHSTLVHIHISA